MSTSSRSTSNDRKSEELRDLGHEAKQSAQNLGQQAKQAAQNLGQQAKHVAQESMSQIKDSAGEYLEMGRERANELGRNVESQIQQQPLRAVLIAAGIGFCLGAFLMRR